MSDDRDWRGYTRRGALGLMGAGGAVAVSETLGFSNVTAGRGTTVDIANDGNALLQITVGGTSLNQASSENSPATIKFTNDGQADFNGDALQTGSGFAVRITLSQGSLESVSDGGAENTFSINNSPSAGDFEASTDLPAGNTAALELTNNNNGGNDAIITFTIEANGVISVENITRDLTVNNTA